MATLKRWARAFLTAAASALIFAAGLRLGAPGEAVAVPDDRLPAPLYAEDEMPAFPNALELPLGAGLELNGAPVRVSYFVTDKTAEAVRDFYRAEFGKTGMPVRETTFPQGYGVTLVLLGSSTTRNVLIKREGQATVVFPSVMPFAAAPVRLLPGEDPVVPYGPSSMAAVDVSSQGAGAGRTVLFHEGRPLDEVRQRIVATMRERGWGGAATGAGDDKDMAFQKDGQRATVVLRPFKDKQAGTSVLFQTNADEEK